MQAEAKRGGLKVVYVAPERLAIPGFRNFLRALKVSLIAIDEAHCISEWGHDFRPEYRNLSLLRADLPTVPIMALTATATERVRQDMVEQLGLQHARTFVSSFKRPNLYYVVRPKRGTFESLLHLLGQHRGQPSIVYRFSRQDTENLATRLAAYGYKAAPYHAGLETGVRRETQERFVRDEVSIIVATIAFGMGIDKADIRLVVHYDLPKSIEGYFQETGCAGRDGLPSDCVLFFSRGDTRKHDFFIDEIEDEAARRNAKEKLAQMVEYGDLRTCRRRFLLAYLGEKLQSDNCGGCDICLASTSPGEEYDATEIAQKVLSAVIRTGPEVRRQARLRRASRISLQTHTRARARSPHSPRHRSRIHRRRARRYHRRAGRARAAGQTRRRVPYPRRHIARPPVPEATRAADPTQADTARRCRPPRRALGPGVR